jgi:hypothetical protein
MFGIEMIESWDIQMEQPTKPFDSLGKANGLLLSLTKPMWVQQRWFFFDSGVFVARYCRTEEEGCNCSSNSKKLQYLPEFISGDNIKKRFEDKEVGDANALPVVMEKVLLHIYAMKNEVTGL